MNKYYEPGDIVTVYEDPITEKIIEGKAKLINPIGSSIGDHQYWKVIFIGDDPIAECARKVKFIR